VTAVEHVYGPSHEREIHVRGYDLLHRLRKRQSVRAHVQVTPLDLARELVADLGLAVRADDSGPMWQRLIQHRQSDLELLVEVVEQCGLYLALWDEVLYLLTLKGTGAALPLALGESLLEARVQVSGEASGGTWVAAGWNPLHVEAYEERTSSARVGRQVDATVSPSSVGASVRRDLVNQSVQHARHAEALAQAELDRRAAYEVTLWGLAEGDPRLRPGARVEVSGVAGAVAGRYVLTSVTHTIDGRKGFVSELSTAPPARQSRAPSPNLALAIVTRVDDPDDLGRVQVSLPTYGDVETEWMHVVCPGAGKDKGLVALPDVDDRVAVVFTPDEPGQGVILGGLYGAQGPPDSGVEGDAVRRYTFVTPGGQRIQLDDQEQTIHLQDSEGSYVRLSPDIVHVHAAVDMVLEAPGRSVTIRGQAIDFESG
jgi:phage protein D/phage baseplate assembly protein gpV